MPFCSNCGNPLDNIAKFCDKCGTPTARATATIPANAASQQTVPAENSTETAPAVTTPLFATPANVNFVDTTKKSQVLAVLFCFFFGFYGVHNFCTGRIFAGLTKLFLLCAPLAIVVIGSIANIPTMMAVGGILLILAYVALSIIVLIDLIKIVRGTYKDGHGVELDNKAPKGLTVTLLILYSTGFLFTFVAVPLIAIAVPKMVGMVANSKASEIVVNVSTYKTMQNAYYVETESVGSFESIGFPVPPDINGKSSINYIDLSDGGKRTAGIAAILKEEMNGCPAGAAFVVMAKKSDNPESPTWTCSIEDAYGSGKRDCEKLSPDFLNMCQ